MKYVTDKTSLYTAFRALYNAGWFPEFFQGDYTDGGTRESNPSAEALTELLDIAQVVNLLVLSDEILVGVDDVSDDCFFSSTVRDRLRSIADFYVLEAAQDTPDASAPTRGPIIRFVELEKDVSCFSHLDIVAGDVKHYDNAMQSLQRLCSSYFLAQFIAEYGGKLDERNEYSYLERLFKKYPLLARLQTANRGDQAILSAVVAKTFQYMQTADALSAPYVCHSFRSPVVRAFHPRLTACRFDLYNECQHKLQDWLCNQFGDDKLDFHLPMFFLAVLKETRSPKDLIHVALQFRETTEATEIREVLSQIVDAENRVNLLKYAELRRICAEQTTRFQSRFSLSEQDDGTRAPCAEISLSSTSITANASVDLLKASKQLVKWLAERNDRRGIAMMFRMAQRAYEVLSAETELHRLWSIRFSKAYRELLKQVTTRCDPTAGG